MKSKKLQLASAFLLSLAILFIPVAIARADFKAPAGTGIQNPLNGNADFSAFLKSLLHLVFLLGTMVVVFFIIFAGFKYVTAQGNPTKISEANQMLLYCAIGAVILLGAQTIADVISSTVQQLGS
jgi:hypothetical protein